MKKTIKIFSLPSHLTKDRMSGVDFARVVQPMEALNGYEDDDVKFETHIWQFDPKVDWAKVAEEYDIMFLNYIGDPWTFAAMGAMAKHFGKKIVFDVDDSLWNIMPDNSAYEAYKPGGENIRNFTAMCNHVDLMTTTNTYLRNVIARNTNQPTNKIKVLPNYIDLDLYNHRSPFKDTNDVQLLHFGSTTHFIDLQEKEFEAGIDMIMKEYPNVTFKSVGALVPKYKHKWGARYIQGYGHQDVTTWIKEKFPIVLDECDLLVVPLADNMYTRCKSNIKWLEASSAKKPGVWQKSRQYEECVDDTNGLLARTAIEWHDQIKKLIDDKELRRRMGEKTFKCVEEAHQIKNNVWRYAEAFKSLLTD